MVESVQAGKLKAYIVRDADSVYYDFSVAVFAEDRNEARLLAMAEFEDSAYISMRPRRCKALDDSYRGHRVMDWYDKEDRLDLIVKANFRCLEPDREDCERCPGNEECEDYQDYLAELEDEDETYHVAGFIEITADMLDE